MSRRESASSFLFCSSPLLVPATVASDAIFLVVITVPCSDGTVYRSSSCMTVGSAGGYAESLRQLSCCTPGAGGLLNSSSKKVAGSYGAEAVRIDRMAQSEVQRSDVEALRSLSAFPVRGPRRMTVEA